MRRPGRAALRETEAVVIIVTESPLILTRVYAAFCGFSDVFQFTTRSERERNVAR